PKRAFAFISRALFTRRSILQCGTQRTLHTVRERQSSQLDDNFRASLAALLFANLGDFGIDIASRRDHYAIAGHDGKEGLQVERTRFRAVSRGQRIDKFHGDALALLHAILGGAVGWKWISGLELERRRNQRGGGAKQE